MISSELDLEELGAIRLTLSYSYRLVECQIVENIRFSQLWHRLSDYHTQKRAVLPLRVTHTVV